MTWLRKVRTILGLSRSANGPAGSAELARTLPHHRETIQRADRVIESYRRFDAVLVVRRPR